MIEHADCPHCQCWRDDAAPVGKVDRGAPFYPLVALIDQLSTDLMRPRKYRRTSIDSGSD